MDLTEELSNSIFDNQDAIMYFWYNDFAEMSMGKEIVPGSGITIMDFPDKFLWKKLGDFSKFSMNSLVYLSTTNNQHISNAARSAIMDKFRNGEHIFGGENLIWEAFGYETTAFKSAYSKLGNSNIEELKSRLLTQIRNLEKNDPRCIYYNRKI